MFSGLDGKVYKALDVTFTPEWEEGKHGNKSEGEDFWDETLQGWDEERRSALLNPTTLKALIMTGVPPNLIEGVKDMEIGDPLNTKLERKDGYFGFTFTVTIENVQAAFFLTSILTGMKVIVHQGPRRPVKYYSIEVVRRYTAEDQELSLIHI